VDKPAPQGRSSALARVSYASSDSAMRRRQAEEEDEEEPEEEEEEEEDEGTRRRHSVLARLGTKPKGVIGKMAIQGAMGRKRTLVTAGASALLHPAAASGGAGRPANVKPMVLMEEEDFGVPDAGTKFFKGKGGKSKGKISYKGGYKGKKGKKGKGKGKGGRGTFDETAAVPEEAEEGAAATQEVAVLEAPPAGEAGADADVPKTPTKGKGKKGKGKKGKGKGKGKGGRGAGNRNQTWVNPALAVAKEAAAVDDLSAQLPGTPPEMQAAA